MSLIDQLRRELVDEKEKASIQLFNELEKIALELNDKYFRLGLLSSLFLTLFWFREILSLRGDI